MLEKYYRFKLEYKEYLILIKCGNFYECIDNDAFIMNKIFNYKLKRLSNIFKVGFPISILSDILVKLNEKSINYIVVNKEDINLSVEHKNNKYNNYQFDNKKTFYNSLRIERIIKYLNDNIMDYNLDLFLDKIEKLM